MGDKPDESGELLREAARAYTAPDAADLALLVRLDRALHTVPAGAGAMLPWQRPPHGGEEGLTNRAHW